MLSEKIVARFMSIILLMLTAISIIHANVNKITPIDSTPSVSISNKVAPVIPLKKDIKVLGYSAIDYDGDDRSYESIKKYHDMLDAVSTFSYFVDGQGNLVCDAPPEELELNRQKGINSLALIHNFTDESFSAEIAAEVLGQPQSRKNLIDNLLYELDIHSYNGVNVDIENVPLPQRQDYVTFLKELKEALSDSNHYLIASIPAKTEDNRQNKWSGAFNYKAIGEIAYKVQLMTYDEHWFGGSPGPIASIGWTEEVIEFAVQNIEPEKILLGIASYGYKWSNDETCESLTPGVIYELAEENEDDIEWDPISQTPYYIYTDKDGTEFTTWFENAKSVSYKLDLVNEYNLGGVALWRLGFEEPELWDEIADKIK